MSTVAVYNGYGRYEQTNEGQKGITLGFAGVEFWFPFDEITYLPDYTFREVDHRESSSDGGADSELVYKTFRISGERLAEEMLEVQIPVKNSDKGLIVIENNPKQRKNSYVKVLAGVGEDGRRIVTDVQEIAPTEYEIADAHARALKYKNEVIQQYILGKRERMMGGFGHQPFPTGLVRTYMEELDIRDSDDVITKVQAAAAQPGITPELFMAGIRELVNANKVTAPSGPAKGGKPQPEQSIV